MKIMDLSNYVTIKSNERVCIKYGLLIITKGHRI